MVVRDLSAAVAEPECIPGWVGDVLLRGANCTPKDAKATFILLPAEVRGGVGGGEGEGMWRPIRWLLLGVGMRQVCARGRMPSSCCQPRCASGLLWMWRQWGHNMECR